MKQALLLAALLVALAAPGGTVFSASPPTKVTTLDGSSVSLAEPGKTTELLFVARWCPPCEQAVAGARRRAGMLRKQGHRLIVIGVDQRESREQFSGWAKRLGLRGGVVFDSGGSLAARFATEGLPWHVVLGAGGSVRYRGSEPPTPADLRGAARPR